MHHWLVPLELMKNYSLFPLALIKNYSLFPLALMENSSLLITDRQVIIRIRSDLKRNFAAVCITLPKHMLELRQYVYRLSLERLDYAETAEFNIPLTVVSHLEYTSRGVTQKLRETLRKITKKASHLTEELSY